MRLRFNFGDLAEKLMFSERSLRGPVRWEAGAKGKQISSRPISSLIWPYRRNNEPLRCCLSLTPDLSPPPTNLHSQTVCFAFTYTYDLKESFRSWISPRPPRFKISIGPFRISGAAWWASFGLKREKESLSSQTWKSLSHSFVTLCLLFSRSDLNSRLVHV